MGLLTNVMDVKKFRMQLAKSIRLRGMGGEGVTDMQVRYSTAEAQDFQARISA